MTTANRSNAHNQGVAHLVHEYGGKTFCGHRGHLAVKIEDAEDWTICKRCAAKLADMQARSLKKAAR